MGGILAFDWFYLPPTHPLEIPDTGNLVEVLVVLGLGVLLGALADRNARRAEAAELARGLVADEQAALRRVATLVATGATPDRLFTGVAHEVGMLFRVHGVRIARYDGDELVHVAEWIAPGRQTPTPYERAALEPASVSAEVLRTGRGARIDDYQHIEDRATYAQGVPLSSVVGAPVIVEDRTWGLIIAWSESDPLPPKTEDRLSQFAELVATAIANAQARQELRDVAAEQSALHRVAALVARAAQPEEVFDSVAREAGQLVDAPLTLLGRYEPEGMYAVVGAWRRAGPVEILPVGTRLPVGGHNAVAQVFETGRSARIDDYDQATGPVAEAVQAFAVRAAVGIPITVRGTLWGVLVAASQVEPLAPGVEDRLVGFSELVATAISNAESQAALRASRARLVTAADTTRRRDRTRPPRRCPAAPGLDRAATAELRARRRPSGSRRPPRAARSHRQGAGRGARGPARDRPRHSSRHPRGGWTAARAEGAGTAFRRPCHRREPSWTNGCRRRWSSPRTTWSRRP